MDGYDKELNALMYIASTKPPPPSRQGEEKVDYTGDDAVSTTNGGHMD